MKRQFCMFLFAAGAVLLQAQSPQETPQRPQASIFIRPYEGAVVPPPRLKNSDRIYSLIRAGKLYLTVQDALAVAIENNLDLEVDTLRTRGAPNGIWSACKPVVRCAASPREIPSPTKPPRDKVWWAVRFRQDWPPTAAAEPAVTPTPWFLRFGPITHNLDPVIQSTLGYFHTSNPQPNATQSQTESLIDTRHVFNNLFQQGLLSGGYVQAAATNPI